ncbi:hypothetical protein [Polymorphospora rubra]|nr:hypothetical protein [Polymorphospora rubra]
MSGTGGLADLKLVAAGGPARITFEPLGIAYEVAQDDFVLLRLEVGVIASIEINVWQNGISVWPPYPGDSEYIILDSGGDELIRLW